MQTLLTALLLSVTLAVAFFDARELFVIWYSAAPPAISTWALVLTLLEMTFCISLAVVVSVRLYVDA